MQSSNRSFASIHIRVECSMFNEGKSLGPVVPTRCVGFEHNPPIGQWLSIVRDGSVDPMALQIVSAAATSQDDGDKQRCGCSRFLSRSDPANQVVLDVS
jgi:hypothetical protein